MLTRFRQRTTSQSNPSHKGDDLILGNRACKMSPSNWTIRFTVSLILNCCPSNTPLFSAFHNSQHTTARRTLFKNSETTLFLLLNHQNHNWVQILIRFGLYHLIGFGFHPTNLSFNWTRVLSYQSII